VLAQRRRVVSESEAGDPRAGHTLGRLWLAHERCRDDPMSIDAKQYGVGWKYGRIAARHAAIMGYSTGSPRSAILDMIGGGISCTEPPSEERILEIREDFTAAYDALMAAGKSVNRPIGVALAVYDICLDRIAFEALDGTKVGDLRVGL